MPRGRKDQSRSAKCDYHTDLLEVGADCENFVHEVFDRQDVILAESVLDDRVVRQRDTLAVNFAVAALVDQLADSLQVWLAEATG
jgi:hypothetical protein